MPDIGTRVANYSGLPDTFRVAPASTTAVRCFGSQIGTCREVEFQAFDENTTMITIGDSDADATSGNHRATSLQPGATSLKIWIDPFDWYVATDGDPTNGVSVTVTN